MAQHMFDNIHDFRQFEPAINMDLPITSGTNFCSIEERICHMSAVTAPVGEMEISATAHVLNQPIHVVSAEDGNVIKYCDEEFPDASPSTVLYSAFGNNSGHYDSLIQFGLLSSHLSISNLNKRKDRQRKHRLKF